LTETVRYVARTAASILYAAGLVPVIGGFVFGLLDLVLVWLERLRAPTLSGHLRHCAILYVLLGTLVVILIPTYENWAAHGVSLGYGLAMTAFFAVGYAISMDATILALQRRRFDHISLGGVT